MWDRKGRKRRKENKQASKQTSKVRSNIVSKALSLSHRALAVEWRVCATIPLPPKKMSKVKMAQKTRRKDL